MDNRVKVLDDIRRLEKALQDLNFVKQFVELGSKDVNLNLIMDELAKNIEKNIKDTEEKLEEFRKKLDI